MLKKGNKTGINGKKGENQFHFVVAAVAVVVSVVLLRDCLSPGSLLVVVMVADIVSWRFSEEYIAAA